MTRGRTHERGTEVVLTERQKQEREAERRLAELTDLRYRAAAGVIRGITEKSAGSTFAELAKLNEFIEKLINSPDEVPPDARTIQDLQRRADALVERYQLPAEAYNVSELVKLLERKGKYRQEGGW